MPVVVIARFQLARQQLRDNAYATKRTAENRSNQTVASDLGGNAIRIQEPEENPMQRGMRHDWRAMHGACALFRG